MQTKNILGIIFSILFIGAFAFAITWAIINQEKVKELMSGTGIYTEEDLDAAYEDGYNTALENKDEYDTLINSYRDTITTQTDEISKLNSQITLLINNNKDYETQIASLESQKTELETNISNLQTINSQNETTITGLNETISELQSQVKILEASENDKTSQISALNTQISNLQTLVSQLQNTNEINSNTITSLNSQIISLNSQISELTYQLQNNGSIVTSLNNKIAQLEESIAYYENYIASLESGEQVVATFEFDGSVYNVQVLNKNATASVITPTSTDYVIFNYWTVNGEQIDLSTYQFTTNTKVVANVTYKYDVKFMVDNAEHNAQIVTSGTTATVPTEPTKSGYEFDGWSLNGVDIVDVTQQTVTANVTYYAVFTQLHTVTFLYEDDTINTQTIRNGEYATDVDVENTTNKIFNGWLLNGAIVDVSTYKILGTTVFTADITYKYNVVFKVDNADYDTQLIVKNGYATTPTAPTKDGYEFNGWSLNGVDIVEPSTVQITTDTTFTAMFTVYKYSLTAVGSLPLLPDGTSVLNSSVWSDGSDIYYSSGTNKQYILNESHTEWSSISWNGYTNFFGSDVWSDGTNFYFTSGVGQEYKIDTFTKTLSSFDWSYRISYPYNLVFVGDDIYYFYSSNATGDKLRLKFNKETCSWTKVTITGIPSSWISSFNGSDIWTDGTNWYWSYSSQQYKINFSSLSLTRVSWSGLTSFYGKYVWTDGVDCYYSLNNSHYILDKDTNTWLSIEWIGLTSFSGTLVYIYNSDIFVFDGVTDMYYKFVNITFKTK